MKKAGYDVSTIHEYQGKQAKHIIVVRTSTKTKEEIYLSPSHVLVAISRHTDSLTYYTPVTDLMRKTLETRVSNAGIDRTKVSNKGGAIVDCVQSRPNEESNCVFVNDMMLRALMSTEIVLDITQRREIYSSTLYSSELKNFHCTDINSLMYFHDLLLPGNSYHHHNMNPVNMLNNELDLELDDVHITESKRPPKISRFDKLRPVLKTFMPISRRPSQIESIIALNKRNMAVPELDGLVDPHALGERLIAQFIGSYDEEENMWLFDEYKRNPIRSNTEAIEDWLSTQDPAVRKMLNPPDEDITHWRWDKYKFMIKPTVKPTLDTTASYTNNALQTIACQEKYHNAIFCPIFKEMDKRLECLYKERFRVFTRTTNEDFAKRMNEIIPPRVFEDLITSGANMLEIDISKYDKSQGLAALVFDCMLMDKVGVDQF